MEENGKTLIVVICKHKWLGQTFEGKQMADRFVHYQHYDLQDLFRKEVQSNTDIGKRIGLQFPAVMESSHFYGTELNKAVIPACLFSTINSVLEKYIKASSKQYICIDSFPSDEQNDAHLRALQQLEDSKIVEGICVLRTRLSLACLQLDLEHRERRMHHQIN